MFPGDPFNPQYPHAEYYNIKEWSEKVVMTEIPVGWPMDYHDAEANDAEQVGEMNNKHAKGDKPELLLPGPRIKHHQ